MSGIFILLTLALGALLNNTHGKEIIMARLLGFETARFSDVEAQEAEVTRWSGNYARIIEVLGSIGTEVRRSRVLETDQDVQPTQFVRGAVHEFIFPPQETGATEDNSGVIDPTPGYALRKEDITREFDEALVEGHIRLQYDDADSRISFHVTDVKVGSVIPEEAEAALEVVREQVRSLQASPKK